MRFIFYVPLLVSFLLISPVAVEPEVTRTQQDPDYCFVKIFGSLAAMEKTYRENRQPYLACLIEHLESQKLVQEETETYAGTTSTGAPFAFTLPISFTTPFIRCERLCKEGVILCKVLAAGKMISSYPKSDDYSKDAIAFWYALESLKNSQDLAKEITALSKAVQQ